MTPDPREHYQRASSVYRALGRLGDYPTIGNNDFVGWYIKRDAEDPELVEAGWPQEGRVVRLDRDLDTLLDRIDRTLYAITTYKHPDAFDRWVPCRYDDDNRTEWRDDKPTPGFEDLRAIPAWGDIDLADELKPKRGELDAETRSTIEQALTAYAEEYEYLYGSQDAVYSLDSVGGAYIFGAPEATLPVAEHFADDPDALARVFEELINRMNDWLADAETRVNRRVPGAGDIIHPDWVQNLNRQYKAPLAIHKDHDAVVTPLNPFDPSYEITALEDVDDDLIEEAEKWAKSLTADEHRECVASLIANLWPDAVAEHGVWQEALDNWVEAEREKEREQERQRREAIVARERRRDQGIEGLPITPSIHEVYEAIDHLDIEEVAEKTIVHQWTDSASGKRDTSGSGKRAFVPVWGPNANGTANYVDREQGIWVDTGQQDHGTAVEMALIGEGGWPRGEIASGEDWAAGVDRLRELGFEIPVWTPDANSISPDGEEYERMPYWALRRAAIALGVATPEDLVEREGEDGEPYMGLPKDLYDEALEAVEEAGLETNREPLEQQRVEDLRIILGRHVGEDDEPLTGGTRRYVGRLLAEIPDEDYAELREMAAQALDCEGRDVDRHRGLQEYRVDTGQDLIVEDGKTYWLDGVPLRRTEILNFELDVKSFLEVPNEPTKAQLELIDRNRKVHEKVIEPKVFHEQRRFDDEILGEAFALKFDSAGRSDDEVRDDIRLFIDGIDAPTLKGTHHMGLHGDSWVVPNGELKADGWAESPKTVYLERDLGIERRVRIPTDRSDYDSEDVATILRQLPKTRDTERFIPVLAWYYASSFRPYIYDWEGEFNLLNITGDTGSGKTTTLRYMWKCFGMEGEPFDCSDTNFVRMATLAATNSIPVWFDEYKPSDMKDHRVRSFHDFIRKAATGSVAQRGKADQTIEEYELQAPVVFSGEQQIDPPAERRRSLLVNFRASTTDKDSPTSLAYKKLVGEAYEDDGELEIPEDCPDPNDHALAYFRWVAGSDRDEVRERWHDAHQRVIDYRSKWGEDLELDDLEVQALQTVVFGWSLYCDFAEEHGVERDELPSESQVEQAVRTLADAIGPGGKRKSHLEQFLELVYRASSQERLEPGRQYALVHEGTDSEELRINIPKTYDVISKYVRDHDLNDDLLGTANDYQKRLKEAYESDDQLVVNYSQNTPGIGRCVGIRTFVAEERLEFERAAFGAMPVDADDSDTPNASDVPLKSLDSNRGYQTVTATIVEWDDDLPEGAPVRAGTAVDATGAVDVVCWHEMDNFEYPVHQGRSYRFKLARVGEYDGAPQVELVPGVTEIEPIQAGAGYTENVDVPEGQGTLNSGSSNGGATENGDGEDAGDDIEDATGRVGHHIKTVLSAGDTVKPSMLAGELGLDPKRVDHALERLADRGELLKEDDGYQVT